MPGTQAQAQAGLARSFEFPILGLAFTAFRARRQASRRAGWRTIVMPPMTGQADSDSLLDARPADGGAMGAQAAR